MSNFTSVNYIITAKHYGNGSARGYIRNMQKLIHQRRGVSVTINGLEDEPTGAPVEARIWQGQWIADCECRSASFVDPDEPVFMCFGCGNRANGQKPRPVIFPPEAERKEIERLLLERPVDDLAGLTDLERAGMARALINVENEQGERLPLTRSWNPGQSPADLHAEQDIHVKNWHKALKEGTHVI
jgi:hypothetical protein